MDDLLFDALWDRVLDGGSRDLLVRASVLRRPGSRDLLMALAGEDGAAAIETLRTTGLLTEIREPKSGGGWAFSYEVHPLVGRLAARRSDRAKALHEQGHRRAGAHLEQLEQTSPSWQDNLEAAYHLRQLGEARRRDPFRKISTRGSLRAGRGCW